jgi:CDP-glycerol glycerophosphotransferase
MPRCDALYGDREEYRKKVHAKYNIPMDAKILMYAPTFRESANQGKRSVYGETGTLDFDRLVTNLEKKFGGTWYICLRVHPQIAAAYAKLNKFEADVGNGNDEMNSRGNRIINGSNEDDMYELLAGMDAYITDYSSPAFEAAYANIPVLIYADDIETYASDRGQLMWNIVGENADRQTRVPNFDAPFPFEIATDNEKLEKLVLNFDAEVFKKRIDKFKNDISLVFDGNASERAAKIIEEHMK